MDSEYKLAELDRSQRLSVLCAVVRVTLAAIVASVIITIAVTYLTRGAVSTDWVAYLIAVLAPGFVAPVASYLHIRLTHQLRIANQQLRALSETDPLTNTLNRRRFVEVAQRELSLAQRHCFPTSLVILDFDYFKRVNDRFGHATGDRVLVHAIEIIRHTIRESDVLARFGGEEFILLLPHTAREGATQLTQRVLQVVQQSPLEVAGEPLTITLSAGSVTCETSMTPLDLLLSRADELLYESKQNGRACCTAETLRHASHAGDLVCFTA